MKMVCQIVEWSRKPNLISLDQERLEIVLLVLKQPRIVEGIILSQQMSNLLGLALKMGLVLGKASIFEGTIQFVHLRP